jgi:hypothetical protein
LEINEKNASHFDATVVNATVVSSNNDIPPSNDVPPFNNDVSHPDIVIAPSDIVIVSSVDVAPPSNIDNDISLATDVTAAGTTTNLAVPLNGSSRTSGGLFRGRVPGNIPNHADFADTPLDFHPVRGEVSLYLTNQYPRDVNFEALKGESDLVVMVKAVGGMASILGIVGRKCSIIQSEFRLCFDFPFKFKPQRRSRLSPLLSQNYQMGCSWYV